MNTREKTNALQARLLISPRFGWDNPSPGASRKRHFNPDDGSSNTYAQYANLRKG